ncbi:MAG: transporter [Candidatus Accumulibacter phosphatis]|jgi:hypothetical protein|nr:MULTISPECIES: transporter [Candidatus Accumulibacter]
MNANGAFKVSVTAIDKEITMNICSDGPAAALSGFSPARVVVCALLSLSMLAPAHAEMSAEELAKLAQNPVGNLISVPFQNNTNLNFGPEKKTQNILNIQPVIPISVNDDWNIITRTIVPVISMPGLYPGDDRTNGIGDTVLTAFVSPAKPGSWIWGVGPVAQIPTNTDNELGNKNWGLGPSVVVLHLEKGSPWVYGALVNNIWSLSGDKQGGSYNNGMIQPFVNYNFPGGLYVVSAPIITANWRAEDSQRWTVPVGGGVGKIFHLGKLPVNAQLSAYYNVVTPDDGANWQIRAQVQFMFPK